MHSTLISAQQLHAHMGDPQWVIIDCRFDLTMPDAGQHAYAVAHIPGAVYAHLNRDLSAPVSSSSGRHPLPAPHTFARQMAEWGIANDSQVVVYDADSGAYAARLWWMSRWLGHDAVAVLDGGFKAWQAAQLPVSCATPSRSRTDFVAHPRPETAVGATEVARRSMDADWRVIDARAPERFAGEIEPIDSIAGHVPGARNHPFSRNLNGDSTFRSRDALRSLFAPVLQQTPASQLIAMCGSGVTACHTLLALEHAGFTGAKLYPGSWSEWIRDSSRPIATGHTDND